MGIGFYRNGKSVNMSWPAADEMVTIIHDLGCSFDPNELLEAEIDDDQAAEIKQLLEDAIQNGRIGGAQAVQDSLGRTVENGYRTTVVDGGMPITATEKAWVQQFIDLCSTEHEDQPEATPKAEPEATREPAPPVVQEQDNEFVTAMKKDAARLLEGIDKIIAKRISGR